MKANPSAHSAPVVTGTGKGPFKVIKQGSITVPIYETTTGFTGGTPPPGSAS